MFCDYAIYWLFSDAEVGEYVVEGVLGGDGGAGDLAEEMEGVAEVFGYEVGGDCVGEGPRHFGKGLMGLTEEVVLAGTGDDDGVGFEGGEGGD